MVKLIEKYVYKLKSLKTYKFKASSFFFKS